MNKDKVLIELLIAILTGINILVLKQSKITIDNEFTRYVKATTKMAKEYLEDE